MVVSKIEAIRSSAPRHNVARLDHLLRDFYVGLFRSLAVPSGQHRRCDIDHEEHHEVARRGRPATIATGTNGNVGCYRFGAARHETCRLSARLVTSGRGGLRRGASGVFHFSFSFSVAAAALVA